MNTIILLAVISNIMWASFAWHMNSDWARECERMNEEWAARCTALAKQLGRVKEDKDA